MRFVDRPYVGAASEGARQVFFYFRETFWGSYPLYRQNRNAALAAMAFREGSFSCAGCTENKRKKENSRDLLP